MEIFTLIFPLSALVLYDDLLTFDAEVKHFWSTKVTGALVLFFANRYLNLVTQCWITVVESCYVSISARVRCVLVVSCNSPTQDSATGVSALLTLLPYPRKSPDFRAYLVTCIQFGLKTSMYILWAGGLLDVSNSDSVR